MKPKVPFPVITIVLPAGGDDHTADASILIPAGSLGEEYYAVSSPHFEYTWQIPLQGAIEESLPGFLSIVASDREARVQINLRDKSVQLPNGMTLDNDGILHAQLRPYDVLTLITEPNNANLAQADLTGVHIRSDQEVSVFGGHTCTYLPHGVMACDHIESLNMPVETWRDEYVGARTRRKQSVPLLQLVRSSGPGGSGAVAGSAAGGAAPPHPFDKVSAIFDIDQTQATFRPAL